MLVFNLYSQKSFTANTREKAVKALRKELR
jgi:hypothetical protein